MAAGKKWFLYQNLNKPTDLIVASSDTSVASVYVQIGGPFTSKADAEAAKKDF